MASRIVPVMGINTAIVFSFLAWNQFQIGIRIGNGDKFNPGLNWCRYQGRRTQTETALNELHISGNDEFAIDMTREPPIHRRCWSALKSANERDATDIAGRDERW